MTGIAIGNSTLVKRRIGFIPIPLVLREGSTSLIPVYVFLKIGNSAYTTNAIIRNFSYTKIGIINPSKARDGIVCNTAQYSLQLQINALF